MTEGARVKRAGVEPKGASGSIIGNGWCTEPNHSLGSVSSAIVVLSGITMCTVGCEIVEACSL